MTKKIKIIFFLPTLDGGGAERVAVNMIRLLDESEFNIILVLVKKTGKYLSLIPEYVTIYDFGVNKTVFSLFKLHSLLQEIKPDIVFSTLIRTHNILYLALLGKQVKPVVVMRSPNSPKLLINNKQLGMIQKFLLDKAYLSADLVIAQTPEMKNELITFHKLQEKSIKVFLNPLDTAFINDKLHNITNPFDNKYINIVAAGRLGIQKGFDVLIKSFSEVIQKNNQFRLYIIGEDHGEKKNLLKLCSLLKLDEYVFFLGFQENPYRYFYYSDLYVLSSRWEGLPNTVLENLYLKKPVIVTRCIPYLESLIQEGKNGFLVNVNDVEALSKAILKYKNIKLEFSDIKNNKKEINNLFKNMMCPI